MKSFIMIIFVEGCISRPPSRTGSANSQPRRGHSSKGRQPYSNRGVNSCEYSNTWIKLNTIYKIMPLVRQTIFIFFKSYQLTNIQKEHELIRKEEQIIEIMCTQFVHR